MAKRSKRRKYPVWSNILDEANFVYFGTARVADFQEMMLVGRFSILEAARMIRLLLKGFGFRLTGLANRINGDFTG